MPLPRRQNPKYASVLQDTHGLLLLDSVQRFMTVDPAMDQYPGWSPYAYVLNNPVKYTDPTGMVVEGGDGEEAFPIVPALPWIYSVIKATIATAAVVTTAVVIDETIDRIDDMPLSPSMDHSTDTDIDVTLEPSSFNYVTYTKTNVETGQVYVGRTSGYGDPNRLVKARDGNHHMTSLGYGDAVLSTSAPATIPGGYSTRHLDASYWAIRGSEQLQIEAYRKLNISGNSINGISSTNPNLQKYIEAAKNVIAY